MKAKLTNKNTIFYAAVLIFATFFLFVGNRVVSGDVGDELLPNEANFYQAVITEITDDVTEEFFGGFYDRNIFFTARITRGDRRGEYVQAVQNIDDRYGLVERVVTQGDRVILVSFGWENEWVYEYDSAEYNFAEFVRTNYIIILGALFVVAMLIFAKKRGFNAIIALAFTCLAIFTVFIPAIIYGHNIYLATIIVCVYAVFVTLALVVGPNKKALSAALGCLGGVSFAAILMVLMDSIMQLTGLIDSDTMHLLLLPTENPINLRAIVFAGVILGVVGAIMDVSMSISSSLWELREAGEKSEFGGLFKSGLNIGRDILGTMLNTLILAYIGSSISLILMIYVFSASPLVLFNTELIVVEFLRALVGSFGMLLTIPLTAAVCGWLYSLPEKAKPQTKLSAYEQELSELGENGGNGGSGNG